MVKRRGIEKMEDWGLVLSFGLNCHTAPGDILMTPSISSTVSVSVMLYLPYMDFFGHYIR